MTTLFSEDHEDRVDSPDRLPPGQRLTEQWPVLTYGSAPQVERGEWSLQVWGEVEEDLVWDWEQFLALGTEERTNDIHCVTHWSRYDNTWEGVLLSTILAHVRPTPGARSVLFHSYGGYTTNVLLEDIARDDHAMLAFSHDGGGDRAGARRPGARGDPLVVFLEERQVGAWNGTAAPGPAGLLGDVRLPPARGSLAGRALLLGPRLRWPRGQETQAAKWESLGADG